MGPSSFQWCAAIGQGSMDKKMEHRKFHTNVNKNFFTVRVMYHWNRLPKEVVESSFLEIFKTSLDNFLLNLL